MAKMAGFGRAPNQTIAFLGEAVPQCSSTPPSCHPSPFLRACGHWDAKQGELGGGRSQEEILWAATSCSAADGLVVIDSGRPQSCQRLSRLPATCILFAHTPAFAKRNQGKYTEKILELAKKNTWPHMLNTEQIPFQILCTKKEKL